MNLLGHSGGCLRDWRFEARSRLLRLRVILPDDERPINQAVAGICLDNPSEVTVLLRELQAVGGGRADPGTARPRPRQACSPQPPSRGDLASPPASGGRRAASEFGADQTMRGCGAVQGVQRNVPGAREEFRFGPEPANELIPAASWSWTDLD